MFLLWTLWFKLSQSGTCFQNDFPRLLDCTLANYGFEYLAFDMDELGNFVLGGAVRSSTLSYPTIEFASPQGVQYWGRSVNDTSLKSVKTISVSKNNQYPYVAAVFEIHDFKMVIVDKRTGDLVKSFTSTTIVGGGSEPKATTIDDHGVFYFATQDTGLRWALLCI